MQNYSNITEDDDEDNDDSGNFNINSKRLCNVGESVNGEDAVNLNVLLEHRKSIETTAERFQEFIKDKLVEEFDKIYRRIERIDTKFTLAEKNLIKIVYKHYEHVAEVIRRTIAMSLIQSNISYFH